MRLRIAATLVACLLAASALAVACAREPDLPSSETFPRPGLPVGDLVILRGDQVLISLEVEIAETPDWRARGLMNVESMGRHQGMAFLFSAPSRSAFHMRNTLIPLDIAFWDGSNRIVDMLQMQPCREDPCPLHHPRRNYVGAVEMHLGVLASSGVAIGDLVRLTRRS